MKNPPCPWLPMVSEIHDFSITRRHGQDKGSGFYFDALRYAQSQWISGKPAQAILQLDKAWMTDFVPVPEAQPGEPQPYAALVWMLRQSATGSSGYLGNPVRHFQHLASRMSGPRSAIRTWRAWVCFHLSERVLPSGFYPRDGGQIVREGLWIPGWNQSLQRLQQLGWPNERNFALASLD